MRFRFLWTGLLALLLLSWSGPALALSCVDPVTVFDTMDVVVRATVTNRPDKHQVVLAVDRYHKGLGPAVLQAEVQGIEPGTDAWMNEPVVGTTYIMGFVQKDGKLVNRPCDLFLDVKHGIPWPELVQKLGQGVQPGTGEETTATEPPAQPAKPGLPWRSLTVGAGVALGLAGLGFYIFRRRSK